MSTVAPRDVGLAGQGDLAALRRMRDHWLELATGAVCNSLLPRNEALPQVELLAELAATGSEEAEDWIALLVAYQVRIEALQMDVEASAHFAKLAVAANNIDDLDRWTRSEVEFDERLGHYRSKVGKLVSAVLADSDAKGSAMLLNALSVVAHGGDERAVPLLQHIMDSVTPERAHDISAAVRDLERSTVQ